MSVGREGEKLLAELLREQGIKVTDVSSNKDYWHKDIDFIISNGQTEHSVEVKNDTRIYKTGNMYIETANPRSQGGKGWFLFCEADYLAYGDAINRKFYFIRLKDLHEYVNQHYLFLKEVSTYDGSRGFLISINDVKELIVCVLE
mgnify:CR=1 FL=1